MSTESILPVSWGYKSRDLRYLNDIQNKFGTKKLRNYPKLGFFNLYLYYPYVKKIKWCFL